VITFIALPSNKFEVKFNLWDCMGHLIRRFLIFAFARLVIKEIFIELLFHSETR
jgi:hypothetical protein